MRNHLLLSSKSPFNWHSIVKIVNAHKPSFISFCHFEDQQLDLGKLVIPIEMQGLFSDIEVEHINMKLDEKYTEKKGLQKRMDIRLGATFSHILINKMVGDDLAIYCTNYRGNKLIRMDKQECVEVENINPLKVLEMSGVSFSIKKAEGSKVVKQEEKAQNGDKKDYVLSLEGKEIHRCQNNDSQCFF